MSSGGGATSAPGLLPGTTLADLESAWKEREEEARELLARGYYSMALTLRLYALEIRIKTFICKRLRLDNLPKACKTHDLFELMIFTGLWDQLRDPANAAIWKNWELLADFSKVRLNDQRYLPRGQLDPGLLRACSDALDDPRDGVLPWLSRQP
jgi:hypothetical protein